MSIAETELTPELEQRARQIRAKPHHTEELVCALLNALDDARRERDLAKAEIAALCEHDGGF